MNVHEALMSGKPVAHPDMIGAYMMLDDELWHRDHIGDFKILAKMDKEQRSTLGGGWKTDDYLVWFFVSCLLRTDWVIVGE